MRQNLSPAALNLRSSFQKFPYKIIKHRAILIHKPRHPWKSIVQNSVLLQIPRKQSFPCNLRCIFLWRQTKRHLSVRGLLTAHVLQNSVRIEFVEPTTELRNIRWAGDFMSRQMQILKRLRDLQALPLTYPRKRLTMKQPDHEQITYMRNTVRLQQISRPAREIKLVRLDRRVKPERWRLALDSRRQNHGCHELTSMHPAAKHLTNALRRIEGRHTLACFVHQMHLSTGWWQCQLAQKTKVKKRPTQKNSAAPATARAANDRSKCECLLA